jgi:hypothetical protein
LVGQAQQFLEKGWTHKSEWPKSLYISKGEDWGVLINEAEAKGIAVIPAPGFELSLFVREAQEAFKTKLGVE